MSENTRPPTGKDNSGKLFDAIIWDRRLKSDAALSRLLDIAPASISKIRHGRNPVSDTTILRVHETIGMPVKRIRELIGAEA
jgi:plasmid maintenance system antidote protein VapI